MTTINTPRLYYGKWSLPEYDKKLAQLRELSRDLGLPVMPDLHIGIQVKDANGEILEERVEQGHSWTRNAWNYFNQYMMDSPANAAAFSTGESSFRRGSLSYRNTVGSFVGPISDLPFYRNGSYSLGGFQGAVNSGLYGIQVGTSLEAFSGEDFSLWGLVSNGTGAGQLSYQAQATPVVTWDTGTSTYTSTFFRVFNNNSGATISINEVGLTFQSTGSTYLFSRDVLGATVNVPNAAQLTITVSITTTSFSSLESTCAAQPVAIGASYGGGIFMGWLNNWINSNTNGGFTNGHTKYALILAPKVGGEATSKQFYNTSPFPAFSPSDLYYGKNNSDILVGFGASSSLGQHCTTQNTAVLGGYSDWYIPSQAEMSAIASKYASIPVGEQPSNSSYWTSTPNGTTQGYTVNPVTGALTSSTTPTTSLTARLVRRIKL